MDAQQTAGGVMIMKNMKGVPPSLAAVGGDAGNVQQIGGISEPLDCTGVMTDAKVSDVYNRDDQLIILDSTIARICECDSAFVAHRAGLVGIDTFVLILPSCKIVVMPNIAGGAECYQQP